MIDDYRYFWKDRQRQLDPGSRRTFDGLLWAFIAGFLLLVIVLMVA